MKTSILLLCLTSIAAIGVSAMEQPLNYKCESTHGSDIVIIPRNDIYGRVNETIEVTCRIDPNLDTLASELVFTKMDLMGKGSEAMQILDNHTVLLKILEKEPSKFSIVCTDPFNNWCVREVSIGYEPLDVLNFHCVSFNLKKLQCAYDLQENPAQMPTDEYYLTYHDGSESALGHKCKSEKCCTLKGEECWEWGMTMANYDRDSQFLRFVLHSENRFGKKMFKYDINQYEQMIPDPVKEDYTLQPLGPHKMSVQFRIPYPLESFKPGIIFRIQYETSGIEKMLLERSFGEKTISKEIELDWPGQSYSVSISIRSGANSFKSGDQEDQWWSTPVTTVVQMPPVMPWKLPEITSGSFRVVDMGSKNLRNIAIFWKKNPKIFQGGSNFTYEVEVYSEGLRVAMKPSEITESYAEFEDIRTNTQYEFRIIPKNIIGMGNSSVTIFVEQNNLLPIEAKFPLAIFYPEEQIYSLRWFSKENNNTQFTLFWCQEDKVYDFDRNRHCMGKLSWVILERNAREANLTKTDLGLDNSTKNLRFAVSTRSISANQNISGGLVWAQYPPGNYSPENSVIAPSLQVKDKTSSTAELEWKVLCQHWRGNPETFEIFWCPGVHNLTSECFGLKNAYQELGKSTFKLQNLRASQIHTVWVRIIFNGWYSELSPAVHFTTAKRVLLPRTIIWLSIGTVVVTIAAIFLAIDCKGRLIDLWKKLKNIIQIPPGLIDPLPGENIFTPSKTESMINSRNIDEKLNHNNEQVPFSKILDDISPKDGLLTSIGKVSETNSFDEKRNDKPYIRFSVPGSLESHPLIQPDNSRDKTYCALPKNLPSPATPTHAYISAISAENITFQPKDLQCNDQQYIPIPQSLSKQLTTRADQLEVQSSPTPIHTYLRAVSAENIRFLPKQCNNKHYISTPLLLSKQLNSIDINNIEYHQKNHKYVSIPLLSKQSTNPAIDQQKDLLNNDNQPYVSTMQLLSKQSHDSAIDHQRHFHRNEKQQYISLPQLSSGQSTASAIGYQKGTCKNEKGDENNHQNINVNSPYTDLGTINALILLNINDLHKTSTRLGNNEDYHVSANEVYNAKPIQKLKPVSEGYVQLLSENNAENDVMRSNAG